MSIVASLLSKYTQQSELSNLFASDKVGVLSILSYAKKETIYDGVTDIFDALTDACAELSTYGGTVLIPSTANGSSYFLNTNFTIPNGVSLHFVNGAMIKISNGITLTGANTCIYAELNRIFDIDSGGILSGTWNLKEVYPEWFGAVADNQNDDTVPIQQCVNFIVKNKLKCKLQAKTYKITSPIYFDSNYIWSFEGTNINTVIKQYTDNKEILILGETNQGVPCNAVKISNMSLTYANAQTSSNTNSFCIHLKNMYYESEFSNIWFGGWYGIKVKSGVGGPWGCVFDKLIFTGSCYGGAMDWTGAANAIPNNSFRRFFVDCVNMDGPIFNNILGYNFIIDTIEFINTAKGATLIYFRAGTECTIGAIKIENGNYTSGNSLIKIETNCKIKISQLSISGDTMALTPSGGSMKIVETSLGGGIKWLEIDIFKITCLTLTGNIYLLEGNTGSMIIKYLDTDGKAYKLTNAGSSAASEVAIVEKWNNGRLSSNKGDSDYVITLGDPNNIRFETTLTAIRNVTLPEDNNNLFNGMKYKITSYGAVNGANTIVIKCQSTTKGTISTDKIALEFTYRRNASNAKDGWTLTGSETLP